MPECPRKIGHSGHTEARRRPIHRSPLAAQPHRARCNGQAVAAIPRPSALRPFGLPHLRPNRTRPIYDAWCQQAARSIRCPLSRPVVHDSVRLSGILSNCPAGFSLSPSPNPLILFGRPIFHRPANSAASSLSPFFGEGAGGEVAFGVRFVWGRDEVSLRADDEG